MNMKKTINLSNADMFLKFDFEFSGPKLKPWSTGNDCIDHILNEKPFYPLIKHRFLPKIRNYWRKQLRIASLMNPVMNDLLNDFHTQWHVCHYLLRELVDDDDLLFDFMRAWLPKYIGPDMLLYRGENIDRFHAGKIGSAWTDKRDIAQMFGRGINAVGQGGMILQANVPASLIIAGPSKHSANCLGENEFTVDPRTLPSVVIATTFPSNDLLNM